ncbi:fibroleukin-like [Anopheles ziemanni]|uniref:fibroleukin-like n=1 Tax=Anopheles coustani TaxID=139045 RepID=UPI00265A995C|nr:fibroleukin-like [Anopheles coustani]XP_058170214.1 fibroleukin-like [Anopheles ziemanni]
MARLDYLQYKLHEMELGRKERDEEVTEKLTKLENSLTGVQWAINRHDRDAGYNLTVLSVQSRKIMAQQTACANHEQMRKEIQLLSNKTSLYFQMKGHFKSCKEAPAGMSGVYRIQRAENQLPFEAFCEQNSFGGGWLVIQYRFNGALDFNRDWAEYENGFGSLNQEFWFGLAKIHQLTTERSHELVVEFKDFNQTYKYARYKEFAIGNSTEQYNLKTVGAYEGTGGDALHNQTYHSCRRSSEPATARRSPSGTAINFLCIELPRA